MPPPLLEEYRRVAPVAIHQEESLDFPGYHPVVAASQEPPVVDLGSGKLDDDDDLGGIDDA